MLPLFWFRQFVVVIVAMLGVSAVLHALVVQNSDDAVKRSMRFDVSWIGAHGRIEAAQLETHLARYAALRQPADAESAELYYQILLGRLDSWDVGGYKEFLDSSPANREIFDRLRQLVESFATEFSDLSQVESLADLLEAWRPVGPAITEIGAEATISAVNKAAAIRETLTRRQTEQSYLVVTLLGAGLLLLVLLMLQNRLLQRAHADARRAADDFACLAHHDLLTGLPNRNAFAAYQADLSKGKQLAVVALDLDGFKLVNDTWGHIFGDKLLALVAHRLAAAVQDKPGSFVGRLGGDEFVALMHPRHVQDAKVFAEGLIADLSRPYDIDGRKVSIGATAGLALADGNQWDMMSLMADADLAQNEAKANKKGTVGLYSATLRQGVERRLRLENALHDAIERGEIVPHYQVQVDLHTNRVVGIEALARWQHPDLGSISPAEFIPIAEASGQIGHIGRYMINCACRDALLLPADIQVAVNLSVIQIMQGELVETVADALLASGLPANRLKLEVTESVLMMNPKRAIQVLDELCTRHVSIALDDFGTGFSSLSYLSTFRWDELKIDRSFLQNLDDDPLGLTVIQSILVLANQLGTKVIVEGIESRKQVQLLESTGCHFGQGFLFGRPEPIEAVREAIFKSRGTAAAPAARLVETTSARAS